MMIVSVRMIVMDNIAVYNVACLRIEVAGSYSKIFHSSFVFWT